MSNIKRLWYCKFCNNTNLVNSKFTIWHAYAAIIVIRYARWKKYNIIAKPLKKFLIRQLSILRYSCYNKIFVISINLGSNAKSPIFLRYMYLNAILCSHKTCHNDYLCPNVNLKKIIMSVNTWEILNNVWFSDYKSS